MKNICYIPRTAAPFKQNETYREIFPDHPALAGAVRCFWGSDRPYVVQQEISSQTAVIPDTCVDIIYHIDYTENTINGNFCGINDTSFTACQVTKPGHLVSIFAIRFFAWSACEFSEDSMKGTLNGCFDPASRFGWLDRILRQQLFEKTSLKERSRLTEELLLKRIIPARQHYMVSHAVRQIISQKGVLSATKLAGTCFLSSRQLERLFREYVGITPKKLCNLVRYQCLWNELLKNPRLPILDVVSQYGYTDQSHLMREFKRYHAMNIREAVRYARYNVENIQSFSGDSC